MSVTEKGQMKDRISFIKKVQKKNDFGELKTTEVVLFSCWSELKEQLLKEYKATIGTVLEDSVTFMIRFEVAQKVTNDMKIKHRKKTYEVIKIMPDVTDKKFSCVVAKVINNA